MPLLDEQRVDSVMWACTSGSFVGVSLDLTNHNTTDIGLDGEAFQMVGDDGSTYPIYYGSFSTSGHNVSSARMLQKYSLTWRMRPLRIVKTMQYWLQ